MNHELESEFNFSTAFCFSLALMATGCMTPIKFARSYDGPALATNQIAILKNPVETLAHDGIALTIKAVDGKFFCQGKGEANDIQTVELLPGPRIVNVAFRNADGEHSTEDAQIGFMAEAGKSYYVLAAPMQRSFGKSMLHALVPHHWYWTIWVVESDSKAVVAGQPRETPIRWWEK